MMRVLFVNVAKYETLKTLLHQNIEQREFIWVSVCVCDPSPSYLYL